MKRFREYRENVELPENTLRAAKGLSDELVEVLKGLDEMNLPDRISHFLSRIAQQSVAMQRNLNQLLHRIDDEHEREKPHY